MKNRAHPDTGRRIAKIGIVRAATAMWPIPVERRE